MICNTCGRNNPSHLIFCEECGQKLATRLATPTPPQGLASLSETEPSISATASRPSQVPQRPTAPDVQFTARAEAAPGDDRIPCALCGSRNQRGLRFCVTCGHLLTHRSPLASAPPAAAAHLGSGSPRPSAFPSLAALAPGVPIAPNRVVQLGDPATHTVETRICARCRGVVEGPGQFCRFCGASLADSSPIVAAGSNPRIEAEPVARRAFGDGPAVAPATAIAGGAEGLGPSHARDTRPPTKTGTAVPTATVAMFSSPSERARLVLIARDGGEGPTYPVGESTDIGRSEGHIVIGDDHYVSPRHARISMRGGSYYLRDLGSTNGVYLRIPFLSLKGGAPDDPDAASRMGAGALPRESPDRRASLDVEHELRDQELFLVGQQVLRFEVVKHADEGFGVASDNGTLLFGTPASSRYARISQRTVEGVVRDVFYVRKSDTVIGRESGDIVFTDDPFLSRRHAVLRVHGVSAGSKGPRRFTLSDLGSSNGTFLQLREEVRLRSGDHFRVGQQLFRFDIDANRTGA